jgi:hypothetical protein
MTLVLASAGGEALGSLGGLVSAALFLWAGSDRQGRARRRRLREGWRR